MKGLVGGPLLVGGLVASSAARGVSSIEDSYSSSYLACFTAAVSDLIDV